MSSEKLGLQADITTRLTYVIEHLVGSKRKLASALGVTPSTVSGWTSGRIFPSLTLLAKLSVLTHCSLDWVLLGKGNAPRAGGGPSAVPHINKEIFNTVFKEGYKLAEQYGINAKDLHGTFFWGLYIFVTKELKSNPSASPHDIIKENTEMLLYLVGNTPPNQSNLQT